MLILSSAINFIRMDLFTVLFLAFFVKLSKGNTILTPSSAFAVSDQEFNLTCDIGSGNSHEIKWLRNRNRLNLTCDMHDTFQSMKYITVCVNTTRSILSISGNAVNAEDGTKWRCDGIEQISEVFLISVFYEPEKNLTMTGYNGSILHLKENLTLSCSAQNGRPWANLSWTCGGKPIQGYNYNTTEKAISELNLHLNESFSGQKCTCTATHPIWKTPLVKSILPLQVFYASTEDPYITGYKSFQDIREGVVINLTCTVSSGYPLPSLSWTCDDIKMDSKNLSGEGVAKQVLQLSVNRTLHGKQCVCNGTSAANYSRTSNVSFIINYPPTVTISFEEQLWNGRRYSIHCQVDVGNPSNFTILWSQTVANTVVRTNADLSNYRSNDGHNLTITAASYQDIGIYTCSVQNNVTDYNDNLLQNKSTFIKRNFSAVFTHKNYTIFHVVLGKSFDVRIPFYCQPNVQNKEDLELTRIENNDQSIKNNSDLEFHLETTKVKIPFYQKFVSVEGQVAVMTFKFISDTTQGSYLLKIPYMENNSSNFQFKIEVHDPEKQTNLPLIIGCSTAVSFVVAIVVVVVVCVFMKHKTNVDEIPVVTIAPYAETRDVIKHSRSTDDDSYADVTIKPTNSQVKFSLL